MGLNKEHESINLNKWPAMVIVGEPVTKEQAAEICIRTSSGYLHCNDHEWNKIVADAFGYKVDNHGMVDDYRAMGEVMEQYHIINLEYLTNARIASSWIGGAHGWAHWNGNIGSNNYNIGKWPSVGAVYEDWERLAKEFPYLNLKCQLFSGETCDDNLKPLIEFVVADGKVTTKIPEKPIQLPEDTNLDSFMATIHGLAKHERGCDEKTLRWAADLVKNKMKGKEHG